jgi:dipeptidyl aminopeptidase/acylaminoacyl peptidase
MSHLPDRRRVLLAGLSTLGAMHGLGGCASAVPPAADEVIAPNANLFAQGIPPIPASIARRVGLYTEFRGHALVDWHPTERQMLVAHRKAGASTPQLFLVRGPLAEPEQLTDSAEPVTTGRFAPRDGRFIVFERSTGGNEAAQIFRLDLATRAVTLVTPEDERHDISEWLPSGELLYSTQPLDRTAAGGTRKEVTTAIWAIDPMRPGSRRAIAELPGGGWYVASVSPDGRRLAMGNYLSANESQTWLLELATGQRRQLLPAPGESIRAAHFPGGFSPDGERLLVVTDRVGEFRELQMLEVATGRLTRISADTPWDVASAALSDDGRWLAARMNVDGREELRLYDGATLKPLPTPASLPPGSVGATALHRRLNLVGLAVDSSQGPSEIHVLDPASGRTDRWTRAYAPAGVNPSAFSVQRIVRWKSFDGLTISGIVTPAPARFTGRRPVIVMIHGGPEAQATMGFLGRWNYFVQELGITIIEPNVRGSSGYGKTFLALDNGFKREDSVKDIGALFDWIATQPDLDPTRVLVTGGSYGGYMTLAVSTTYPDRIAGGISVVGISNFVTFLTNTESYPRDLRRVEYGDERDPAMRAFQERIAPLNNAQRITKPLFVVQGRNDPRVPYTEAEQMVERVRRNGQPVWYLRGENEGHGFARKENADFQFYATVKFIEQTLLR